MRKLLIKTGQKLNQDEIDQINQAQAREFKVKKPPQKYPSRIIFFLLLEKKQILAMGKLIPVKPVFFNKESFSLLGIGGIVANEKGKGYGKKVMVAIKKYLMAKDKAGIGFCRLANKVFYEKCGFKVETTSIKRFIFRTDGKKITNSGDDCVLYLDSTDRFMEKVLSQPNQEIVLPRPPDW